MVVTPSAPSSTRTRDYLNTQWPRPRIEQMNCPRAEPQQVIAFAEFAMGDILDGGPASDGITGGAPVAPAAGRSINVDRSAPARPRLR